MAILLNRADQSCSKCTKSCTLALSRVKHLIYNRVPKCGSRTTRHLIKRLSLKNGFILNYYQKGVNMSYRTTLDEQKEIARLIERKKNSLYIRHVHFIDFQKLGVPHIYNYLNLIREPLQRLTSQYYYIRKQNLYKAKGLTLERVKMTFNECVEKGHYECRDPDHIFKIIPFFCGHSPNCTIPSRWALEQAIKNVQLYFPVVGYLENMQQFLKLLELAWPQFFTGAIKVYSKMMQGNSASFYKHVSLKAEPLTPTNERIMKTRLALEYEFYNFIRQRFDNCFKLLFPS